MREGSTDIHGKPTPGISDHNRRLLQIAQLLLLRPIPAVHQILPLSKGE